MEDVETASQGMRTEKAPPRVFSLDFSGTGVVVAAFFFLVSLTPSLLPRSGLFQGFVSGVTIVIGYGLGVAGQWVWEYLELPKPKGRAKRIVVGVVVGLIAVWTFLAVWTFVGSQNDVRSIFGMDSISPSVWVQVLIFTPLFGALVLIAARSLWKVFFLFVRWLDRRLSRRLSQLLGGLALALLLLFFFNGVLVSGFFTFANATFSVRDGATAAGVAQPQSVYRSGSPESLAEWGTLGRQGRSFVALGPTAGELNEFHGGGALQPIRVYAGLKSADSLQERADLVLEELKRSGAFDREVLVVATTTGTGFLDPNAVDTLEYLHNGNTAIVGVQYSYLPSWISLLADQAIVKETSRAVFDTIHRYYKTLPESSRPEIYIHGLSLGSYGAEAILTSINVINEPINGAVFAGPPFVNELWNEIVDDRDPGSPAWLPIYENGRTVRFTSQQNALDVPTGEWQDTKVVYLQHASDPVVFFSPSLAFTSPEWLEEGQRGPDVSDEMFWMPLVTMWQVAADLPAAGSVPEGFGHLYSASSYIDSWLAVTEPEGWSDADTQRLKALFAEMAAEEEGE